MKTLVKFILVAMMIMTAGMAFSQQNEEDVVYLKNGGILRGSIIELSPDQTVKIQTSNGNVFIYSINEIEKISRETAYTRPPFQAPDTTGLKRGYYGLVDFSTGFSFGEYYSILSPNLSIINGYRINPYLATGAGFGLHYYGSAGIFFPFFADIRANFVNKPTSPYLSLGIGYGLATPGIHNDEYNKIDGGFLLSPSFGVCLKLKRNSTLNLGLSYEWQKIKITSKYMQWDSYYNGNGYEYGYYYPTYTLITSTSKSANHTLSFTIGIGF